MESSDLTSWPAVLDRLAAAAADVLAELSSLPLLSTETHRAASILGLADSRLAAIRARFTQQVNGLEAAGQSVAATDVLTRSGHMSGPDARRAQRVADTLGAFPELSQLLADGAIGTGHLDTLAGVVKDMAPETRSAWQAEPERLVDAASGTSPEDFGRRLKQRRLVEDALAGVSIREQEHRKNRATTSTDQGRYRLTLDADAETGMRIDTALQAEMDAMRSSGDLDALHPDLRSDIGHLRFYAAQRLLSRGFESSGPNRTNGQVSAVGILIDEKSFLHGPHEHSVCELTSGEPVEIETARRLACEGLLYRVVLSADSVVLDLGRTVRVANREQRRALRAMYRTCAISGCQVPFARCEVHHVRPWLPDGLTDIENLVPLCLWHHHQVHDNRWTLTLDTHRTLRLYRPDGTLESEHPLVGLLARTDPAPVPCESRSGPPRLVAGVPASVAPSVLSCRVADSGDGASAVCTRPGAPGLGHP